MSKFRDDSKLKEPVAEEQVLTLSLRFFNMDHITVDDLVSIFKTVNDILL